MAEIFSMFPAVASIVVICYLICEAIKLTKIDKAWIPVISGILGGVLAVVGTVFGVPALAGLSIFDCIATGIVSGLGASGAYDVFDKMRGKITSIK